MFQCVAQIGSEFVTVCWYCPCSPYYFVKAVKDFRELWLTQLTHTSVYMTRIFHDRLFYLLWCAGSTKLLQIVKVLKHLTVPHVWMAGWAELRWLRNHTTAVVRHLRLVVDLFLIKNARRRLRLTLLSLLNGTLLSAELLVLNFIAWRFDVVRVVLLKVTGCDWARFLKNNNNYYHAINISKQRV